MPVSSLAAGDGAPSRAASAIFAGDVSGYHLLKIVGYSLTKVVPNGTAIDSRPFTVGGHTWFVKYYPNGDTAEKTNFISLSLVLVGTVAEDTKVHVTISLLDQDGNPWLPLSDTLIVSKSSETRSWGYSCFLRREDLEKTEHLRNDSFTVRLYFTVRKLMSVHTMERFVTVPPSDMHRHFGDLLSSKECTDVTFRVGGETFSAHRLVLAARSPVFKAELYGLMRESFTRDVITIDDMEAEVFGALLTFMYTDALPEMDQQDELAMAQHLLVAADRYYLERLKLICEDKLCSCIDMENAATILALAKQHNCLALKETCLEFIRSSVHLEAVMETNSFKDLIRSHLSVLKELMSKLVLGCLLGRESREQA